MENTAINGIAGSSQYQYDNNGNLVFDSQKSLQAQYNYMDLPRRADFIPADSPRSIAWLYDALGNKLRKTTLDRTVTHVTDYFQGIEYVDNALVSIYHAEGRVNTGLSGNFVYQYAVKDHLNNTRITLSDNNQNFSLDLGDLNEYHYYPFGLLMEGNNTLLGNWNGYNAGLSLGRYGYSYFYNAKEWNTDNGLNWYDYGKLWYDPTLGRFPSVDPIIDEFPYLTPYNYASNDPVKNIDLWGLQGVSAVIRQKVEALSAWLASDKPTLQKIQDVRETLIPNITTVMDAAGQGRVPNPNELGAATFEFAATFLTPAFVEGKAANISSKAASAEVNSTRWQSVKTSGEGTALDESLSAKAQAITKEGVVLPKGEKYNIPENLVENPHNPQGTSSYGVMENGKFKETLRIDPATPVNKKGPNYSHYHKDGKKDHYSPNGKNEDPGFKNDK